MKCKELQRSLNGKYKLIQPFSITTRKSIILTNN